MNGLIGKTILSSELITNPFDGGHEVPDTLVIRFTDNTSITITAEAILHSKSYEPWAELTFGKEVK